MAELLTIGEVARRSGVAASALRFYEEKGMITSDRAGGGQRRFPRHVLRRIAFIVFAQRIGLSLDEIALELAKLPHNRAPTGQDWQRLSATWTSRNASAAGVCHSSAASCRTPAIVPRAVVRARGIGSATGARAESWPTTGPPHGELVEHEVVLAVRLGCHGAASITET